MDGHPHRRHRKRGRRLETNKQKKLLIINKIIKKNIQKDIQHILLNISKVV